MGLNCESQRCQRAGGVERAQTERVRRGLLGNVVDDGLKYLGYRIEAKGSKTVQCVTRARLQHDGFCDRGKSGVVIFLSAYSFSQRFEGGAEVGGRAGKIGGCPSFTISLMLQDQTATKRVEE